MNLNNNHEALTYSRRSGNRKRSATRYMIEGDSRTLTELAEMAGCSSRAMSGRLGKARRSEGPVTYEKLGITR